ncbi:ABC-F type ribosomal protection protein [Bacillus sp. 31A1R]|uniref:ABC-F type ribosomal protection protein n=1 Tax=Robertmurraya mangrovi TaxID=3098077 RepID=A0ABU5ITL9_9BACI|nr:ABC-F type ribosomal protection protein [Bacillus sp. 31A1R]MDZ5470490.1 ABC-F type ribosomal protection protein [Bacillus sp. 31A1R]
MTFIRVKGINKSFAEKQILNDISFDIKANDRIGLVGYNGCGKTTLANILFGKIKQDTGTIEMVHGSIRMGYLLQSIDYTVNDFQQVFSSVEDPDLLTHSSQLGLGKIYEWEDERLNHLSGGEKLKLSLAKVWSSKPDMLILDEPTNHLDFKGLQWLVEQIKAFIGPILIISHDRSFLDQSVNQIFEIEEGKLQAFSGNYSAYREEKKRQRAILEHQYTVQQRYKERIEGQMVQLRQWSDKAHRESTNQGSPSEKRQMGFKEYHRKKAKKMDVQIRSKMKRLEMELDKNKIDKPKEEVKVRFQFDASGKRGKRLIEAIHLSKSFNERTIFSDCNFYIKHGERMGIIGDNGAGKTTWIKMLLGQESVTEGDLWKSESLKIAYLSQDVHDLIDDLTVIEALNLTLREDIFRARTILANLGLSEKKIAQKIKQLSLGERIRVKLTDILMKEYDVLILDEPTNHLDLPSREQLEDTLSEFTGTILVVSHDAYFLERLCDRLLVFKDEKIIRVETGLKEYNQNKYQIKDKTKESADEKLMIINNRITAILGELSLLTPGDEKYHQLDLEFKELIDQKKLLLN